MPEQIVPVFKAGEASATLAFWSALGFGVLYDMRRPYTYLSLRRNTLQFDFSSGVGVGFCLVTVDDVDATNASFRSGIKAAYGRQFRTGQPRLGLVSQQKTDRRFNLTDPAGNQLLVLTPGARSEDLPRSPLAQAIKAARLSTYGEGNLIWAADHLDAALAAHAPIDRTRLAALILRGDIAAQTGDNAALHLAVAAARAIVLPPDDHAAARFDLERLTYLQDLCETEPGS